MIHLTRLSALILLLTGASTGLTANAATSPGAESPETIKPAITVTPEQVEAGLFFQGELVVLRATAPTSNPAIIIVSGPKQDRHISKKTRQTGIWLNGPSAEIKNAPGYLAVFSSGPIDEFNFDDKSSDLTDLLGFLPADSFNPEQTPTNPQQWQRAYGQLLKTRNLLINRPNKPLAGQHNQFLARLLLPSSAPTGQYRVTLVTQNENRLSRTQSQFEVVKVGLVKQLEQAAFTQPVIYGVGSLLLALLFGWLIGVVFSRR